jgi:hypothetical protein
MFKKIISFCTVLCMALTLILPLQLHAQSEAQISQDTVITEDNIYEVLKYLNIDSSNFIKTDVSKPGVKTVGELKKVIEQVKQKPIEIKENTNTNTNTKSKITENFASSSISGTKMLYQTTNTDSYTLEFEVAGLYTYKDWTGATSANVTVDTDSLLTVFKISNKHLNLSWNSSTITLNSDFIVDTYIGAGDIGLIHINANRVIGTNYWYSSNEISYAPPAYPGPIQYGATGYYVGLVQTRLNYLGFNCGEVDNSFGPATKKAVIAFQNSRGLDPDGSVGPITWSALFN